MRLFPVKVRYAWPSELDLMARLAGLELRNEQVTGRGVHSHLRAPTTCLFTSLLHDRLDEGSLPVVVRGGIRRQPRH